MREDKVVQERMRRLRKDVCVMPPAGGCKERLALSARELDELYCCRTNCTYLFISGISLLWNEDTPHVVQLQHMSNGRDVVQARSNVEKRKRKRTA